MMWRKRFPKSRQKRRGQTLVEFALIFPVMLFITYGLIEMGRFVFVFASVNAAAREAARYGAAVGVNPDNGKRYFEDCDGIRAAARRVGRFADITDIQITYDYGDPDANQFASSCPPPESAVSTDRGARIRVVVTAKYKPFFLFSQMGDEVTLTADSARTIVRRVPVLSP